MPTGCAGYWRDLGQPHYYLRAHRELLTDDLGILNDPDWPILTRHTQRGPARVLDGAEAVDSMLSSGCVVRGRVERSVLGPGVRVERGARVTDAVLFADVVVEADAEVVGRDRRQALPDREGCPRGTPPAPTSTTATTSCCSAATPPWVTGWSSRRGARLEPGGSA